MKWQVMDDRDGFVEEREGLVRRREGGLVTISAESWVVNITWLYPHRLDIKPCFHYRLNAELDVKELDIKSGGIPWYTWDYLGLLGDSPPGCQRVFFGSLDLPIQPTPLAIL